LKTEKYLLYLKSSEGIITADAKYQFDEDNDLAKVELVVDKNMIEVSGDCAESVFRKLSRKLSDKYKIHSCYTCRFGNFSPLGDQDNEIFCINDFEPKSKSDLFFLYEDVEERKKRCCTLFDVCGKYQPCSEGYWTYK